MSSELVTVTPEESARDYLPKRITHGHAMIGAVYGCQDDTPCNPYRDVVVSFNPETRRILGIDAG